MTIVTRNRFIISGLAFAGLLLIGFLVTMYFVFDVAPVETVQEDVGVNIAPVLLALFCEVFISIIGITILYFSFRKTTSPEVFFFIVFLVAMAMDSLKVVQILFDVYGVAPYYGMIVSRVVYFGKYLGTLAVFGAGLISTGIEYQRTEMYLMVGALLAFALAATVPLDTAAIQPNLLYRIVRHREIMAFGFLFQLFAVAGFVFTGVQNANKDYYIVAAGMALAVAGREILFYRYDPISIIVSFVLLIVGTTLFGERTHEVHLWA